MSTNKRILIGLLSIFIVIFLISTTYAFFSAIITGNESVSTIVATGGIMEVAYDNLSGTIEVFDIYPKSDAWVTKNFTITGTNTTDAQMFYKLGLKVDANTFSSGALTYSLTSTNTSNKGEVIASKTNEPINMNEITFGTGAFSTGSEMIHTYTFELFFKDIGENQNIDQDATFAAHITVSENTIIPWDGVSLDPEGLESNAIIDEQTGKMIFKISSADQMAALIDLMNNSVSYDNPFPDMEIILENNIDFNNQNYPSLLYIGSNLTFNGNNHTIYNLKGTSDSYYGLIAIFMGTSLNIKDLKLNGVDFKSQQSVGSLIGVIWYGSKVTVENCYISNAQIEMSNTYECVTPQLPADCSGAGGLIGMAPSLADGSTINSNNLTNVKVKGNFNIAQIGGFLSGNAVVSNNIINNVSVECNSTTSCINVNDILHN